MLDGLSTLAFRFRASVPLFRRLLSTFFGMNENIVRVSEMLLPALPCLAVRFNHQAQGRASPQETLS